MALPKLTTPEYTIQLLSLAKPVRFRPYLVREEKILLMAQQGEDKKEIESAVKQILRACTFDAVDIDALPSFDLEYLYLQLRARSVNNIIETRFQCQNIVRGLSEGEPLLNANDDGRCKTLVTVQVNLDDVRVQTTEGHTKQIMITDDIGLALRYPTAAVLDTWVNEASTGLAVLRVLNECIEHVYTASGDVYEFRDQTEQERQNFIESLSVSQLEKVSAFFQTMPVLSHSVPFRCPKCAYEETITLQGLDSFFG